MLRNPKGISDKSSLARYNRTGMIRINDLNGKKNGLQIASRTKRKDLKEDVYLQSER